MPARPYLVATYSHHRMPSLTKLICCVLLLVTAKAASQQDSVPAPAPVLPGQVVEWAVGYYGDLIYNPGLRGGVELPWTYREVQKGNGRLRINERILTGELAGYWNPNTHGAFLLGAGVIWRTTWTRWGGQIGLRLLPLVLERTLLSETYEVIDGRVNRVRFPGRTYYAPTVGFTFGKLRPGRQWSAYYFNTDLTVLWRYNRSVLPALRVAAGYRFGRGGKPQQSLTK